MKHVGSILPNTTLKKISTYKKFITSVYLLKIYHIICLLLSLINKNWCYKIFKYFFSSRIVYKLLIHEKSFKKDEIII